MKQNGTKIKIKIKIKIENLWRDTDDTNLKIIMWLIHVHDSPSPMHTSYLNRNAVICYSVQAARKKISWQISALRTRCVSFVPTTITAATPETPFRCMTTQ